MKTISEIIENINLEIEKDFQQPTHLTLKRKNKNILNKKREKLKERINFIEINEYIDTLKYLKAMKPLKPKDKTETKQVEL